MGIQRVCWGILVVVATACSAHDDETGSTTQAATSSNGVYQNGLVQNGVYQNGLTTNGVYQNGVYQNGVYQNGVYQNGVYQNGVYQNGVYQNGVYQNGVYQNGVYQNGVYQNGVYQNGVYQNGLWTSGLWSSTVWAVGTNATALRTNAYTRQFFKYVYACAMPGAFDPSIGPPTDPAAQLAPGYFSTSLDPNNGTLACNASGGCDDPYYTCNATTNRCIVQLDGAVGLGVNADGSTWWHSGTCDETCQRWVTACVLARTNAYGVHVDISMRAPDDAPQTVKNALYVAPSERDSYGLREGAYFGNIFATQPLTPQPAGTSYSGDPGTVVASPQFFACAGPGSSIPEITKRFCSSQGDQAVIQVPGACLPDGHEKPVCAGEDADPTSPTYGAIHQCYTSNSWTNLTPFSQVITVYLKTPISVCGNAVCEADEGLAVSTAFCPSDCHAGTWANAVSDPSAQFAFGGISAFDPAGAVYVIGNDAAALTLDSTGQAPVTFAGGGLNAIVKYGPDGTVQWSTRLNIGSVQVATVAPDHGLVVIAGSGGTSLTAAKLTADGTLEAGWPMTIATTSANSLTPSAVRVDGAGNIFVVGMYRGSVSFPGQPDLPSVGAGSIFAAKLSPQGQAQWVTDVIDSDPAMSNGLVVSQAGALDGNGDLLVAGYSNQSDAAGHIPYTTILVKLDGTTGAVTHRRATGFNSLFGVTSDPNDPARYVYTTGDVGQLTKFTADLQTIVWTQPVAGFTSYTYSPSIDSHGNIVVIADFWRSAVNIGAGLFNLYAADHLLVAAYTPDNKFVWAKHIPTVLGSRMAGAGGGLPFPAGIGLPTPSVAVDARGNVDVSGGFAGSVQVDDRMRITQIPSTFQGSTFVGSFAEPSPTDHSIIIGDAIDQLGNHFSTIPSTISVEATSGAGATVFFMPPTALDPGGAGTNVSCSPPPNTVFPIGTTTVTCTATNSLGDSATAQFTVVVHDALGPTLSGVPADFAAASSTVTYPLPTAVDQIGGAVPVTCTPASGTTFATGATVVTCSASDRFGNTTRASFTVAVAGPSDTVPPVISVPAPITAPASNRSGAAVSYTATASDAVDGAVSPTCAPASGSVFPLGSSTVTCTARDAAGNTATSTFSIVVADMTPPAVTVPAPITTEAVGGGGAPVTFSASASDNVDGSDATACTPGSGSMFAIGTTTVTCAAHDVAGNPASATFPVTVTDTTPPAITVPATLTAPATGINTVVSYSTSATDLVDGAVATSCSPASGTGFPLGTTTVSCTAADAHHNAATRTFLVQVQAQWSGVLQPVNADGSSVFRLGSTVPVKFQLTGPSASITNAVANLSIARVSGTVTGTEVEAVSTSAADSGNQFRYDTASGQYTFNLSTRALSVGTWQLRIDLHDGVLRTINLSLR